MATQYHWRDERRGVWTNVEFAPHEIVITLRPTYLRGAIVGILFIGFGIYWGMRSVIQMPGGLGFGIGLFFVAMLLSMLLKIPTRYKQLKQRFPLVITDQTAKSTEDASDTEKTINRAKRHIDVSEISAVVVRENAGRNGDDTKLYQVYLHLHDTEFAELIYQHYYHGWTIPRVLETAEKIASQCSVPCVVESEET